MRVKTLRTFQETAVASGISLFAAVKRLLDVAPRLCLGGGDLFLR